MYFNHCVAIASERNEHTVDAMKEVTFLAELDSSHDILGQAKSISIDALASFIAPVKTSVSLQGSYPKSTDALKEIKALACGVIRMRLPRYFHDLKRVMLG